MCFESQKGIYFFKWMSHMNEMFSEINRLQSHVMIYHISIIAFVYVVRPRAHFKLFVDYLLCEFCKTTRIGLTLNKNVFIKVLNVVTSTLTYWFGKSTISTLCWTASSCSQKSLEIIDSCLEDALYDLRGFKWFRAYRVLFKIDTTT